jgi:hypothetical protein
MSAELNGMHECPVRGCTQMVPDERLLCVRHWRRVSRATNLKVYHAYRKAPGSAEHVAICKQAVAEAEGQS